MTKLHLFGIGQTHHGSGVKTSTYLFAFGQILVLAGSKQIRRVVLHCGTSRELQVFFELANDAWLFCAIAFGLRCGSRHDARPCMIGFDQTLGFGQSLFGITAQ